MRSATSRLLHVADIHAQLMPVYFREPSINLGVGAARGQPPHLTGQDFLKRFKHPGEIAAAYALTAEDFAALAKTYGRIGGLDRMATVREGVRAERGGQGAAARRRRHLAGLATRRCSKGQDMVDCMALLEARRHDRPLGVHLWRRARSRR